jgi:transcription-repair coupling factor (superfamily II helicase)
LSPVATSLTLSTLLRSAANTSDLATETNIKTNSLPSAQALAVAAASISAPLLVVLPTDAEADQMLSDVQFFYGSIKNLDKTEVSREVILFPSPEVDPYRGISAHLDIASARARTLVALAQGTAQLVIASAEALVWRVSPPSLMLCATMELIVGGTFSPTSLGDLLVDGGFLPEDPVDEHGEFCVRGGVVDFFPAGDVYPVRVEFSGDTIESLRRYDPGNQRSIAKLERAEIFPLKDTFFRVDDVGSKKFHSQINREASFLDYLKFIPSIRTFMCDGDESERRVSKTIKRIETSYRDCVARGESPDLLTDLIIPWEDACAGLPNVTSFEALAFNENAALNQRSSACQPVMVFHGRLGDWVDEVRKVQAQDEKQLFVASTTGRAERIIELLRENDLSAVSIGHTETSQGSSLLVATGHLSHGFRLPAASLRIYSENDLFDEERGFTETQRSIARSFLSDLRDLKVGDHVVHLDHGIGKFVGLTQISVDNNPREFVELRYAGGDKLFVPVENLDLIQKYTGAQRPTLIKLGGTTWERAKTRVRRAMRDMAEDLLKLYAARKAIDGHSFGADTHWQDEFEADFEFELTPDQQTAVRDIKRDMEASSPMDRLLCGDVGYGKTEVALRAAFKAVMDGKQVALLAPTTVLTFQHYKTLIKRFAAFPIRIELINRFRNRKEQKKTLKDLEIGKADVIVGTHRLLSKDVKFNNLGLLVVDEEQRFGVGHKEQIKQLRQKVDVLTLTATPIPRTLNMSLIGIRDMSVIETPPKDRLSIQTNVLKSDPKVIANAIRNELDRSGQVFFVHDRIDSIDSVASLVTRLVPEARVAVAHGRSSETILEKTMIDFIAHKYDVLLSTTIIENGLDIPNVNTIIVNNAQKYGLAQLYQLRGRIGRSNRRAYAYLIIPTEESLSRIARQRLTAIRDFSDLGSGFRIAALDLEIRGAGNLLGAKQSGHIDAIGFDMYIKLLERTVKELKGEDFKEEQRATVNLGVELRIDENYIVEENQRLAVYRRVAAARNEKEFSMILAELKDRYGTISPSVVRLVEYGRIRALAKHIGVESVERERHLLILRFKDDAPVDLARLVSFVEGRPNVTLMPPGVIRVDLKANQRAIVPRQRLVDQSTSWWTKRATTGQVEKGFTKKQLLRSDDIEEGDKLLETVHTLLTELSNGD